MGTVQLYEQPGCPYCARVKRVLDELEVPYETHVVPPSHAKRDMVERLTGRTQVPVISDPDHGVEGMDESERIIDYLRETYG